MTRDAPEDGCVQFLQWALPQMRMRWSGFRKVRRQVCKRIQRQMRQLGLEGFEAYRAFFETHVDEWQVLDSLCRVTISRFYRNKGVFDLLGTTVLPELAGRALSEGRNRIDLWSAGCGSGEEPYTVALLWQLGAQAHYPDVEIRIIATDSDPGLLRRAARACYTKSALREIPEQWVVAFSNESDGYLLRQHHREPVTMIAHDLRSEPPSGRFDLVLCRNLAFTYWDEILQVETAHRIESVLRSRGYLVIGAHEDLPREVAGFRSDVRNRCFLRKE